MRTELKSFVKKSDSRNIKKFVIEHVSNINIDFTNKFVNIMLDKKYSYNALHSTHLMEPFVAHIKSIYGNDYEVRFYTVTSRKGSNREMLIPNTIHFS